MAYSYIVDSPYNKEIVGAIKAAFAANVVPDMIGDPGTGKTAIAGELAKSMNYRMITLLGNSMDPTDVAGMPVRHQELDGTWTTKTAPPEWAYLCLEDSKGNTEYNGTIVFLDELNTAVPAVQAAFLTMLQSRKLPSGLEFPEQTKFIAAMNHTDDAADGWDLAAPLANRLMHIDWNPPVQDWYTGMLDAWGNNEITDEERSARVAIVTFLRQKSHLVSKKPEDAVDAGRAWPSRRSWDNVSRVLGNMGHIESISPGMISLIASGLVGEGATAELLTFLDGFTLPNSEDVLTNPEGQDWDRMDSDKVYAIVGSVIAYAGQDRAPEALEMLVAISGTRNKDIVAAFMADFIQKNIKHIDHSKLREVAESMRDLLKGANYSGIF